MFFHIDYWHLFQFSANNITSLFYNSSSCNFYTRKYILLIIGTKINLLPIINLLSLGIKRVNYFQYMKTQSLHISDLKPIFSKNQEMGKDNIEQYLRVKTGIDKTESKIGRAHV